MHQINILIAEDDPHIRMGLKDTLESENYHVIEASDGNQAMDLFQSQSIDLALLDIMMPEKSGYDVCRDIRAVNSEIPIIMLTAKSEEIDKVVGLELGADDYITKPFGVHELLARINAVLRRSHRTGAVQETRENCFEFAQWQVDPKTYKLNGSNGQVDLTEREIKMLSYFKDHPGQVKSRDEILNAIWGIEYLGTTRTLDQHIAQLRKKVELDPSHPTIITTVHGVGYRYEA